MLALSLSSFGGMEVAHLSYAPTYYQDLPIHLSAQKAAEVMSVVSASLTFGKLVTAFISIRVKSEIIIAYHLVILAISMAVLYFGCNSETLIWIGNGLMGMFKKLTKIVTLIIDFQSGFGFSAIWSAYFSLAEEYVGLTNNISSVFLSVSSICPMITPFVCGPLIEKNPQIFLLIQFIYFIITIILFILIMILAKLSTRSSEMKMIDRL